MYYAYTALAVVQAFGQEGGKLVSGLVAVQSVQVNFTLNDPAPAAQITQNVLRQPLMQILRFIPAFQAVLQFDAAMQAFMQCRAFVGDVLKWASRGRNPAMLYLIRRRKSFNASHRSVKSELLGVC